MKKIFIVLVLMFVIYPTISNADVTGGNPAVQRTRVDAAEGILFFDLNNPISQDGVINSWRIYTTPNHSGTGHIKLKIFRD
ncbi:MAG: hypothetical protein GY749_47755, partial [Desulfobacteraceae bacterium]|nr:hypothetical protein [Desulfobacteraceae bacterium]